ncbi:MAG: DUF4292 domain-containing protein [Muribaculaceae bacterium]|nr:DUF4292 domain-containing protein [Muribaculaceae bacterium]
MKPTRLLLFLLLILTPLLSASAQDAVTGKEEKQLIETLTEGYKNWNKAGWSGKLSADILPVSATLKVYMEKGKLTLISIRAPFLGEVGRIEADTDSVVVINKMKRRYYSRQTEDLSRMVPDLTEDFQSLLLGRMFVVGEGELDKKAAGSVTIFPASDEGCFMIVPDVPDYLPETLYGFSTDTAGRLATFVCAYGRQAVGVGENEPLDPGFQYAPEAQLQAEISYPGDTARAAISASFKGCTYDALITCDGVEYGAKGFDRLNLSGYRRCGLREVLRF